MAVIGINYDEGADALNYKSVYIHSSNLKVNFDSGNFIKDWYDAIKKYLTELSEEEFLSHSSSVNHFIMDGAKFDSAYLHMVDGKAILKYFDKTDPNWWKTQSDVDENGIEFFVPENTQPTWEELKEMCN
jgi:hypothetical protein